MATCHDSLQQHVVAVPLPAQGHLNSLMRLCKLLAKQPGFIITFVDFDPVHARLQQVQHQHHDLPAPRPEDDDAPAASDAPPLIRRVSIPIDGLDLSNIFSVPFGQIFRALPSMAPYLEQLLLSLNRHGPPVTCILSDVTITIPTQDVADKFGIPRIVLYPFSASRLLLTHYISQGEHNISMKGVMEALAAAPTRKGEVFCSGLPGLPTIFCEDLPHFQHIEDDNRFLWEIVVETWQACNARAHGVVVNSFMDLERSAFHTLFEACTVPIYDVGCLAEPLSKDDATSLWKEDMTCLSWLDRQPTASVLYISFGSITLLSSSQLEEFQEGLISSKHRFLWVFRAGLVHDIDDGDHSSRIASIMSHGRGLVVSWAPQLRVLAHPSVGGFLTHCGWNSTTEAIIHGVPMLCWPYFVDQPINARCIIDVWKVGIGFKASKNGLVERDEVEKDIRALMEGEEGRIIRQNATCLKEKSGECFLENGSSSMKLKALINSLLHHKSKPQI